jgi:hypothetical protein
MADIVSGPVQLPRVINAVAFTSRHYTAWFWQSVGGRCSAALRSAPEKARQDRCDHKGRGNVKAPVRSEGAAAWVARYPSKDPPRQRSRLT